MDYMANHGDKRYTPAVAGSGHRARHFRAHGLPDAADNPEQALRNRENGTFIVIPWDAITQSLWLSAWRSWPNVIRQRLEGHQAFALLWTVLLCLNAPGPGVPGLAGLAKINMVIHPKAGRSFSSGYSIQRAFAP